MKGIFILCLLIIVISFTISTVIGCVMASIDIIRSPKRYRITASADEERSDEELCNDKTDPTSEAELENVDVPKRVIS
ncbi:MAG: hypothetical protein IJP18_04245 [Oscillospiraceae bacterium]|nr:hypothetical protein [Oscillospiraceae bacterium]